MNECMICSADITTKDAEELNYHCRECHQNLLIKSIAAELRDARITFEEVMRKIMIEVDR